MFYYINLNCNNLLIFNLQPIPNSPASIGKMRHRMGRKYHSCGRCRLESVNPFARHWNFFASRYLLKKTSALFALPLSGMVALLVAATTSGEAWILGMTSPQRLSALLAFLPDLATALGHLPIMFRAEVLDNPLTPRKRSGGKL